MNSRIVSWTLALAAFLSISTSARAGLTNVNLSTAGNASAWVVTGGGAVNAPAFQPDSYDISLTSNAFRTGTFATGGSSASFNGFWYADSDFFIPAGATSISLLFSGLRADDRAVLQLNGTDLGDYFQNSGYSNPPLTGLGVMSFPPGPPDISFVFTGISSGIVTSGFNIGGMNDLRLVINNTSLGVLTQPTQTFATNTDGTAVGLTASLTYTTVPEPASLGLTTAIFPIMLRRQRR